MIIVNDFFGKKGKSLGNNIIQLSNIIHIALYKEHNVLFKVKHELFDLKIITDYLNKYNNEKKITDRCNFFYRKDFSKEIFKENIEETKKLLKEAFIIKNINKLDEDVLLIHIRSGDLFVGIPHPAYIPPPLSYYIKQINKYNYKKIIIVSEDKRNPVVNKLLELYENAIYNKNNLIGDIKLILSAQNILYSIGSFIPSLMLISDNLKELHTPFQENDIKDYYSIMKPWKNTEKQREYILSYKDD